MTTIPVDDDSITGRITDASGWRIIAVMTVIVLYAEIGSLQFTMIGAALQKMTKSFPTVGANLNWAVIIITLIGAAATPLLGKLGDIHGKKKIFLLCGVFFIAGCLIDAITSNWTLFLIGRGLSALAIATQLIAYGLIRDLMPRKYVPLMLGITATGAGLGSVLAPTVGGLLVDNYSWRALFWFLGIFTLVMTPLVMLIVPETKLRAKERIDPVGALLLAAGAALVLLYLDKGQDWGWSRVSTLAWLAAGVLMLVAFVVVELRVSMPIINMRLLAHPRVSMVLLMGFFGTAILAVQGYAMGYMTQTPSAADLKATVAQGVVQQAHQVAGVTIPASAVHVAFDPGFTYGSNFSLLQYGLRISVVAGVAAMIFGPIGGLLARRFGARLPSIFALVVLTGVGVAYATSSYSWVTYAVLSGIFGIGFGMFYACMPNLLVDAVPQEQQGITAGMFGVLMNLAAGTALAVVTALLNNSPVKAHIDVMGHNVVETIPQVFADRGYTIGFWIVAGTSAVALLVAIAMRHGRTPAVGGAVALIDPLTVEIAGIEAAEPAQIASAQAGASGASGTSRTRTDGSQSPAH